MSIRLTRPGLGENVLPVSPADVLRNLLVSAGYGTMPQAQAPPNSVWPNWPVYAFKEPETTPDNTVTIYDFPSGQQFSRNQITGEQQFYHGTQIIVRSVVPPEGWYAAYDLGQGLDQILDDTVIIRDREYLIHSVNRGDVIAAGSEKPSSPTKGPKSERQLFSIRAIVIGLRLFTIRSPQ